jgi:hypothetical protein
MVIAMERTTPAFGVCLSPQQGVVPWFGPLRRKVEGPLFCLMVLAATSRRCATCGFAEATFSGFGCAEATFSGFGYAEATFSGFGYAEATFSGFRGRG